MKLNNPNDDPILARINNILPAFPVRKRKRVVSCISNKRKKQMPDGWRRADLSITIPIREVVFGEDEQCDHQWTPQPRLMGEHTTYACGKCGEYSGCA